MAGSTLVAPGVNTADLPPNAVSGTVVQASKPVSAITTQQGADIVQQKQTQAATLATPPPPAPTKPTSSADYGKVVNGSLVATPSYISSNANAPENLQNKYYGTDASTKITLIKPDTQQTVTFSGDSISKESVDQYIGAGYQVSDTEGTTPDWLTPNGVTKDATGDTLTTALSQAKSDLDAAKTKLTNFNVSNDPDLQATLAGISSQWDDRISQLQNAEDSRVAALQASGIRMGAQYTGGITAGVTGSIISAEERASVNQIASLQQQKTAALTSAKNAYASGQWKQFSDLVTIAQKAYDNQLSEIQTLQKAQATQDAKIQQTTQNADRSANVTKLYAAGTTDPQSILDSLRKGGDTTTTLENIAQDLKAINPTSSSSDTFKFTSAQTSKMLASGLNSDEIQALHDYYNGNGDASALSSLPQDQQNAVHDVLNGTTGKTSSSSTPKTYTSGSLHYTPDVLGGINQKLTESKGSDGYVDPNVYKAAFDAWTADGGLPKDFLTNFPPKSLVNPANDMLPDYLKSKTTSSSSSSSSADIANQINALFK